MSRAHADDGSTPADSTPPVGTAAEAPKGTAVSLDPVQVTGHRTDDFRVDTSTVGSKFPTPVRDIPQQVTIIPKAVIESQADDSLYKALDNVPGIVITPSADTSTGDNINLRGFSARTDIYLDGLRDRGQYFRDTFDLEGVEVLEGAASLLFGHGSTGGIINQVSKRASLVPGAYAALSLGTDTYDRATFDLNHSLDSSSAFRLNGMVEQIDGTRPTVDTKSYGVAPTVSFGIDTLTQVDVSLLSQHNNDHVDYGFPLFQFEGNPSYQVLQAPFDYTYQYTDARVRTDVNIVNINLNHTFAPNIKLRSSTSYGAYNVYQNTGSLNSAFGDINSMGQYVQTASTAVPAPPATPLDSLTIASQEKERSERDSSLFNQTDLLFKFRTGEVTHELIVGGEFGRDEYHQLNYNDYNFNLNNGAGIGLNLPGIISLGQTNNQAFPSGANVFHEPGNVTDLGADTLAGYFNDTLTFAQHWKVVAGLRWDDFSSSQTYTVYNYPTVSTNTQAMAAATLATNDAAMSNPSIMALPFSSSDYLFSPRAGVIWQPSDWQSYYASYSTSFDPLALEGSSTTGQLPITIAQISSFVQGGGLKPEETRVEEVGAKFDLLAKRLSLSSALFNENKFRTRFTDPDTGNIGVNGKERARGAELKLVGQLAPGWQMLAAYTWLDGKIQSSPIPTAVGRTLSELSRNSASLWTTYDFHALTWFSPTAILSGHFQIGGGLKFISQQYVINNAFTAYGTLPGYTRFDATAAYVVHRLEIRLNIENVLDRDYFSQVNSGRAIPGDGRRAIFTVGYHFL